jgi:SAM-dependent methyltransferase
MAKRKQTTSKKKPAKKKPAQKKPAKKKPAKKKPAKKKPAKQKATKRAQPAKKLTQAQRADRHDLYERAVQSPEMDIEFFEKTFKMLKGRDAMVMREDFCGTANLSAAWCRSNAKRTAIGLDLDPEVLAWGRARNLDPHPKIAKRVRLHEANVLEPIREKADVTCAMNFSYCIFKTRDELRGYFEIAREGLKRDGIFICELYGGTEAVIELEDEDEKDGFNYHWDQEKYDPITAHTLCHIHFSFSDGSKLRRAFTYDWRLWSIPEIRELMLEAGFSSARVYWEEMEESDDEDDDELEPTGEYLELEEAENQEAWLVYIVAER